MRLGEHFNELTHCVKLVVVLRGSVLAVFKKWRTSRTFWRTLTHVKAISQLPDLFLSGEPKLERENHGECWRNVTSEGEPIVIKNNELMKLLIRRSSVRATHDPPMNK
jgi:hypothetical protein